MANIIGNIAALIGLISVITAMVYINTKNNSQRGIQWIGISYIALVIAYFAVQFS